MMMIVHPQRQLTGDHPLMSSRQKCNMKAILGLGIAEVSIGSLSLVLGIAALVNPRGICDEYKPCYSPGITIGEGIWCGLWIIVGGSLGVASGKTRPLPCLLYLHMAFSIIATLFSTVMMALGITFAIVNIFQSFFLVIVESFLAIFGFISMSLCITSAVFCSMFALSLGKDGCCECCFPGPNFEEDRGFFVANSQPITFVQPGLAPPSSLVVQGPAQPNYIITGPPLDGVKNQQNISSEPQSTLLSNQKTL